VVGWAPIALGIGWLSGEISGCGRFAAGCDDTAAMSAWVAQIAALVVLLLVGRLARIASFATLTTLAAAIPAALLLSATGNPDDAVAGRTVLSGLLAIAWAVGGPGPAAGGEPAPAPRAPAQQGDPRIDLVRRGGRRALRARLGRRLVVRDHLGDLLDAQPEGVRRSAQARSGVPGTGASEPG